MSKARVQGVADDAAFLSLLTQAVRSKPGRFRAGAALVESLFSVGVLRVKHAAIARELMEAFPEGHPIHEWERDNVRTFESDPPRESDSMRLTMSDAESWAREQSDSMERADAEAVCLIAVALYDDNPKKNPALPKCMRSIPWGGWSESGKIVPGRWFRFDGIGIDADIAERARVAWARVESWGADNPEAGASAKQRAHAGIRLAMQALGVLLSLRPDLKSATQPDQYAALCALHRERRVAPYRGLALPRESSFWAYVRQGQRIMRDAGPNVPQ